MKCKDSDRSPHMCRLVRQERFCFILEALKKEAEIQHPVHEDLSFLVGTMFTDGNDEFSEEETAMICVFADKQVV